ncbi:MAG: hypothetical protein NTV00_05600 [Methylococcales bacterium]|nr:hypothetical protein [Methylococcales bacterium]
MSKKRNTLKHEDGNLSNPVAKHAHKFNKAHIFRDKSQYTRKAKHSRSEAFIIQLTRCIIKASDVGNTLH